MAKTAVEPATTPAKIKELQRELELRREVYRKRVADGVMPRWRANHQYFVLKCILDDYLGDAKVNGNAVTFWQCPFCTAKIVIAAGIEIGYCQTEKCGKGPFYLQQYPKPRTQGQQIERRALLISGIDYNHQQSLFADEG